MTDPFLGVLTIKFRSMTSHLSTNKSFITFYSVLSCIKKDVKIISVN